MAEPGRQVHGEHQNLERIIDRPVLPLGTELNRRCWCLGQDWACCRMTAWPWAPLVYAAHVLTQKMGHILALQAIPLIKQLVLVTSRLHFGFESCHHPLGHPIACHRQTTRDQQCRAANGPFAMGHGCEAGRSHCPHWAVPMCCMGCWGWDAGDGMLGMACWEWDAGDGMLSTGCQPRPGSMS